MGRGQETGKGSGASLTFSSLCESHVHLILWFRQCFHSSISLTLSREEGDHSSICISGVGG